MDITLETYLIVCPLVFLAGLIDSIGGGGGLISLPAYLLAGIPAHYAIATNKLSSSCGTLITTLRFIKNKMIHAKLALPSIFAAILGSYLGAKISMLQSEKFMEYLLLLILPVVAVVVFHKKNFEVGEETELKITKKLYGIVMLSAFIIGIYDGFYGPGTGTFLIIAFTLFGRMSAAKANGQAKIINLTTNITSLSVFLLHGQVLLLLGITAAIANMLGAYIGSGFVLTKGSKIVRPSILLVLALFFIRIIWNMIGGYTNGSL